MPPRDHTSSEEGFDQRIYEVTLTDTRESTGSASLESAGGFVRMMGGEADDTRLNPIWPREISLELIQEEDLSVLTDASPEDIEIDVTAVGDGPVAKGLLFPDEFEDRPLGPQPDTVELSGSDGLQNLGNTAFEALPYELHTWPLITPARFIWVLLAQVYGEGSSAEIDDGVAPVEVSMRWWPETSTLKASDLPLAHVVFDPRIYEGETALFALKDVLKAFGLTLRQTVRQNEVRWHLRQPDVALGGSYALWELTPGGATQVASSLSVRRTISGNEREDFIDLDHGRTEVRPRERVEGVHNHDTANYVINGGFERLATDRLALWPYRWTDEAQWDSGIGRHADNPETPASAYDDQWFASIEATDARATRWSFTQDAPIVLPNDAIQVEWSGLQSPDLQTIIKVQVGNYVLVDTVVESRTFTDQGDVVLSISEVGAPIPEGAKMPVYSPTSQGLFRFWPQLYETTFEVSERAPSGSTSVAGNAQGPIEEGWGLFYLSWEHVSNLTAEFFQAVQFTATPRDSWASHSARAAMSTGDGTDISALDAQTMDIRLGVEKGSSDGNTERWFFDDIAIRPAGSNADSTRAEAVVDTPGTTDEFESQLGSGPSFENDHRLRGEPEVLDTYNVELIDPPDTIWITGTLDQELLGVRRLYLYGSTIFSEGDFQAVGYYLFEESSYDSANDRTEITIDTSARELQSSVYPSSPTLDFLAPSFDAFYWGVGANPSTTYPLHELRCRRRLRQFRRSNSRLELVHLYDENISKIQPHEVVELEGQDYTIASYEDTPTEGRTSLTLLEHNDYGTA